MEFGIVFMTVVLFALLLAIVAGFGAAHFLMHASESRPSHGGRSHDR